MSFETAEQIEARRIQESKIQKLNGGSLAIPKNLREKFMEAMKMDAATFFSTPVIWDYSNGKITATIKPRPK